MELKDKIKNLRKGKFSQEELAALLKVSYVTISRWENGTMTPTMKYIPQLAEALNTTSAYLLGETDDPRPSVSKGEAETKAQAQTEPEQLLIEDKGAGYKDVSASRGVLRYKFSSGREIELPDTPDNRAFFQEIVRGDLKQLAY
ncbi:MAG: helix-turn-helix transcriptional regulator [Synergistaceae bacterium]|nr:helix-turn-helix transcriptional regulator [Synergistaceae bacterium]